MPAAQKLPPRPGWYADPADPDAGFRWWDGQGWTALCSPSDEAAWPTRPLPHQVPVPQPRRLRRLLPAAVTVVVILALVAMSIAGQRMGTPPAPGEVGPPTVINPAPRQYNPFNTSDTETIVVYEQIAFPVRFRDLNPLRGQDLPGVLLPAKAYRAPTSKPGTAAVLVGIMHDAVVAPTAEESARLALSAGVPALYAGNVTAGEISVAAYPQVRGAVIATTRPQNSVNRDTVTLIAVPFEAGAVTGYGVWLSVVSDNADPAAVVEVEASQRGIRRL
ncbi:DUF2510 domain-containing protein [Granulicoccus phenolivorans]|uniref:DUF2510 domain-containing protein n=1 Tax=Granulicoccus phenolivorans TaxID=266854 RepID=UPI0004292091|nr:DUF2510 domain-containing protein [Granulicoccus phenolivorans]